MKTKLTFKSILDGLATYWVYYLWTAFMIWAGLKLLNLIDVTYLQCLGGLILVRQLIGIIKFKSDRHLTEGKNE